VCAFQGAILGVFAYVLRWAQLRSAWRLVVLVPVALCAVEWVYPLLFQSYTGVAMYPVLAMVQIADLGGVLLLSALQGAVNGAIADMVLWWRAPAEATAKAGTQAPANGSPVAPSRPPLSSLTLAAALCAASSAYGLLRLRQVDALQKSAPSRKIGIAQPNVGELELHQNPQASVRTLWDQTAELHGRGADLVVWPEAGFNLRGIDLALPEAAEWMRKGTPVSLIAGAIRMEPMQSGPRRHNVWNSAILVGKDGKFAGHFDKIALLAFGEYIPFGDWFPILYQWSPMSSPYSRGTTLAPLVDGGFRYSTFICYEDILPGLVRTLMAETKDGRPHAMVNLTNDSWYGTGNEQEQHLILAAIRSIEHRRWLIRATSTGVSAFVDATGRVVQRIGRNERGVAVRDVPMLEGTTPYQVLGEWPGALSLLALAFLWVRGRLRPRTAPATSPDRE
jgi:apolipoprotein N-acyltransferase